MTSPPPMATQASLPSPYRLAVYFARISSRPALQRVDWTSADAERVRQALASVSEEGLLQRNFLLANSTVQGNTLRDVRMAAARYNADAILVIELPRSNDITTVTPSGTQPESAILCARHGKPAVVHGGRDPVGCSDRGPLRHPNRRGETTLIDQPPRSTTNGRSRSQRRGTRTVRQGTRRYVAGTEGEAAMPWNAPQILHPFVTEMLPAHRRSRGEREH